MSDRQARVCPDKDCMWRSFGDPTAKCPTHWRGIDQPDVPYVRPKPERPIGSGESKR